MTSAAAAGVVVVGAGLAGLRVCEQLRALGYDAAVTLVGAERHPPYSRPPLSKEVLRGEAGPETTALRRPEALAALDLDLRLGVRATRLRVAEQEVSLDDHTTVRAEHVVIATGAHPRTISSISGGNVFTLRTVDDALGIREALGAGTRLVIVGAGFIGLEVAASAVHRGCQVTVCDVLAEPLARVADPAVGAALRRMHEAHGVRFRLGVGVAGAEAADGVVTGLRLADGTRVPADVVLVAVGVRPTTGWLDGSGLVLDDGVRTDAALAAAPGVWAVGDLACWPHGPERRPGRVEHWTNALDHAKAVAASITTGAPVACDPVPYFWSDQYDASLVSLGEIAGDEFRVVWGALDEPRWVGLVRRGDLLAGVVGLRAAGQVTRRRQLLLDRATWAEALA